VRTRRIRMRTLIRVIFFNEDSSFLHSADDTKASACAFETAEALKNCPGFGSGRHGGGTRAVF
jgi:hypothetical protein